MAKVKEVVIGTNDIAGATVVSVDYNEITLERDGRTFRLELENETDYHSMCSCECGGCCGPGYGASYFIARELI